MFLRLEANTAQTRKGTVSRPGPFLSRCGFGYFDFSHAGKIPRAQRECRNAVRADSIRTALIGEKATRTLDNKQVWRFLLLDHHLMPTRAKRSRSTSNELRQGSIKIANTKTKIATSKSKLFKICQCIQLRRYCSRRKIICRCKINGRGLRRKIQEKNPIQCIALQT